MWARVFVSSSALWLVTCGGRAVSESRGTTGDGRAQGSENGMDASARSVRRGDGGGGLRHA
ncbi:MAG TPA: hypothetical protein VHU80_23355 [Polyangiaceae bacterium]|nr:hypothetical protein [Polyangiaceae bacterium]